MTLASLIRKGGLARIATATPATPATQEADSAATVAEVATVTVANLLPPALPRDDEAAIRAWLACIAETNLNTIAEVLDQCHTDPEARAYFLRRAEEIPSPSVSDQRGRCEQPPTPAHRLPESQRKSVATAGLWDTDKRWFEGLQRGNGGN